jgi:hypothetical protein
MRRRDFLKAGSAGVVLAGTQAFGEDSVRWWRNDETRIFKRLTSGDDVLAGHGQSHVLGASVSVADSSATLGAGTPEGRCARVRAVLSHELKGNVLEATATLMNEGPSAADVCCEFSTSARPAGGIAGQRVYLPLSASALNRDPRLAALGSKTALQNCDHGVGQTPLQCNYLEPLASFPDGPAMTRALLLAPVVDIFAPGRKWSLALFTPSNEPARIRFTGTEWLAGRQVRIEAGATVEQRCYLHPHTSNALEAWRTFHRFAHKEDFEPPEWLREMKVHYYDFLSSAKGKNGHRGDGYEADVPHFPAFHVGMATQHGYYPALGDFIHPDRPSWKAMKGHAAGPAEMSIEKMRERIKATRRAGARAAVYMHPVLLDGESELYRRYTDHVLLDEGGKRVPFGWAGPDTVGKTWRASLASLEWRAHILQQTQWVMELLEPDAITLDETFAGIGYDHHPNHGGPMALAAMDLYRRMRAIVKSHGDDRAFLTSDCSATGFVLWGDGECGDHAYDKLLGHELYRQEPVRYLAAIGDKLWRPCAWHFQGMWKHQMALARQVGSGVGVSNGWIEFTGLAGLSPAERKPLIDDIESLL